MRDPLLALSAALLAVTCFAQAQPARSSPGDPKPARTRAASRDDATQLPVSRVSLYKNGVGFFEHSGRVTGDQAVAIDFTSAQLNDVLQSLTAIDLGGGRISGAGYNSTTPLDQQLKVLPLALGEAPTSVDFYNAIRGARVEVRSPTGVLAGRLLSFEVRTTPGVTDNAPSTEKHFVTIASESGDVRTFELTPATTVRLLDTPLRTDLTRYLHLLDANRNGGLRHLTLFDKAPSASRSARDLRVSYLSEVPVWKSTYRILFTDTPNASSATQTATLQGWSVVDNTTGTDWINVQLSLIAGSPQSFIQPLSQPIYTRRPEIPIAEDAQLTPQTHESGEAENALSAPTTIPKDITMLKEDGAPPPQVAGVAGMSGGSAGGVHGGVIGGLGSAPGSAAMSQRSIGAPMLKGAYIAPPVPYETSAADSVTPTPPPPPSTTTSPTTSPIPSPSARTSPRSSPSSRPKSSPSASPSGTRSSPAPCARSGSPTPPRSRSIAARSPSSKTATSAARGCSIPFTPASAACSPTPPTRRSASRPTRPTPPAASGASASAAASSSSRPPRSQRSSTSSATPRPTPAPSSSSSRSDPGGSSIPK